MVAISASVEATVRAIVLAWTPTMILAIVPPNASSGPPQLADYTNRI